MCNFKVFILILVLNLGGSSFSYSEDSPDSVKALSFEIDVGGAIYHQSMISGANDRKNVLYPDYLYIQRLIMGQYSFYIWTMEERVLTDNPLRHGASYIDFMFKSKPTENLSIFASLVAEHRGFSLGTYNQYGSSSYLKYLIDYRKRINSGFLNGFGEFQEINLKVGTFQDFRYYEGLQLYNIDFQAVYGHFQLGHLRLSHLHIGDLKFGIGLNIGDWADYMVSLEDIQLSKILSADIRVGIANYMGSFDPEIDVINFSIGIEKRHAIKSYFQAGYRIIKNESSIWPRMAWLAGVYFKNSTSRIQFQNRFEFRRYGKAFNSDLRSKVQYRDWQRHPIGNYVGSQLYPLNLFERPFGQWAVFTEYADKDVNGFILKSSIKYYINHSLFINSDLDINIIDAEDERPFEYPFYKIGLGFKAKKYTYLLVSITNKAMNLDLHYPSFYCMKYPLLQFELKRDLNWLD
jgi:hypothetical protein